MEVQSVAMVLMFLREFSKSAYCQTYTNVAIGKPAIQSSVHSSCDYGCTADLAVDGLYIDSENVTEKDCVLTAKQLNAYWQVDLGQEYEIPLIIITNTGAVWPNRFQTVLVTVGNTDPPTQNCSYFEGPGESAVKYNFSCPPGLKGQYVRVQLLRTDTAIMSFCEVRVMTYTGISPSLFEKIESMDTTKLWHSELISSTLQCALLCKYDMCVAFIASDMNNGVVQCKILHAGQEDTNALVGQNENLYERQGR